MKARRPARQRGLAIVFALALIGLAGLVSTALSSLLSSQITRTRHAQTQAQLRQLLQIGAQTAASMIAERNGAAPAATGDIVIPLPKTLQDHEASLTLRFVLIDSPQQLQANIDARLDDYAISQTLHFEKAGETWTLVEAQLERLRKENPKPEARNSNQ